MIDCFSVISGVDCDTDINECDTTNICGDEYKVCNNTVGSYTCTCKSGYTEAQDGTCTGMSNTVLLS